MQSWHTAPSPPVSAPPARFDNSSLTFLAEDLDAPPGAEPGLLRGRETGGSIAPSEEGKRVPRSSTSPAGRLGAAPVLVGAPEAAVPGGSRLQSHAARRLRRARHAEVDAHGHVPGHIPGSLTPLSIPPAWAHTHCCVSALCLGTHQSVGVIRPLRGGYMRECVFCACVCERERGDDPTCLFSCAHHSHLNTIPRFARSSRSLPCSGRILLLT